MLISRKGENQQTSAKMHSGDKPKIERSKTCLDLRSARPPTGVSRALRAQSVSPKTGVSKGVSTGCPWGSGVSKKCPESVPRVSGTPFRHSGDTLGTLFGHSGARGPKGPRDTPWDTLLDTPVFGDTLGDTPWDTLGPKGPRDSSRGRALGLVGWQTVTKPCDLRCHGLAGVGGVRNYLAAPSAQQPSVHHLHAVCSSRGARIRSEKNSPKSKFRGRISTRIYPGGRPGVQKLRSSPRNPGKPSISVRTSMTRRHRRQ